MTENWNACLAAATGQYFLLLSDDDLLAPEAIASLVSAYQQPHAGTASPGIVYGGGQLIDAEGNLTRPFRESPHCESGKELIPEFFLGNRDLFFCAVLLRTEDLLPGFQSSFRVACDTAVWLTAALRRGTAVFVPGNLVSYRQHQNLSAHTSLEVWRDEYRQLHALILKESRLSGTPDPAFERRVTATMKRLDRSLVAGRINQEYANRKARALLLYGRHLPAFATPRGLVFLLKALAHLLLPAKPKAWLRKRFGKGLEPAH